MKTAFACVIIFSACVRVFAEDFTTTDGKKLEGVTVTRIEPDGIVVMTDSGIEKIVFTKLPEDVQKKYGFDPAKAAQFQQQRAGTAAMQRVRDAEAMQAEEALKRGQQGVASLPKSRPALDAPGQIAEGQEQAGKTQFPAPQEGKIYTLDGLEKAKFTLEGKVVQVRVSPTTFKSEQLSQEEFRVFVKDDEKAGSGYAHIYFPTEGLRKMDVLTKPDNYWKAKTMTFYVLVSPDKYVAIARSVSRDIRGKITYVW